jgi:putative acetyltransferase
MWASKMNFRPETAADIEVIHQFNCIAFGKDDEARLVDALRDDRYARLSLVAEIDDRVVGHILFSYLPIISGIQTVSAFSLAPIAVLPEH